MARPGPNAMVANPEMDLLHRVLGLTSQTNVSADLEEVVFVCVDCEAYEFDQTKVTELGVAVLDTKDLAGTQAGQNGEGWIAKMKYGHYRPVEYAMTVNRRFVKGCEDKFAFEDTRWINLKDAPKVLTRIFASPERVTDAANLEIELPDSKRNVVFVAHGISNDDAYLNQLGFKLGNARNIVRLIDSQRVAGGTKKNKLGLKRLLEKLGVQHQGLHNAGNDAAYTLQAVTVMAVMAHRDPGLTFGNQSLPPITLPGVVRGAGVAAKHVFGGTAKEGAEKLPLNGGKPAKDSRSWKKQTKLSTPKPAILRQKAATAERTAALPALGSYATKRSAPEGEDSNNPPSLNKHAR